MYYLEKNSNNVSNLSIKEVIEMTHVDDIDKYFLSKFKIQYRYGFINKVITNNGKHIFSIIEFYGEFLSEYNYRLIIEYVDDYDTIENLLLNVNDFLKFFIIYASDEKIKKYIHIILKYKNDYLFTLYHRRQSHDNYVIEKMIPYLDYSKIGYIIYYYKNLINLFFIYGDDTIKSYLFDYVNINEFELDI